MRLSTFTMFNNLPPHEKKITLSTMFTFARIFLTPCVVACMLYEFWGIACTLFIIASITDLIDGSLARWRNERTFLGAALDPIADKFLLLSCFFTLAFVPSPLFTIPLWFVLFVLCKEVIVIGGACVLYAMGTDLHIQPTMLGKMTTVVQIMFIVWLFACYFFQWVPTKTYNVMLGLVLVVVFASLLQYVTIGYRNYIRA